MCSVAPERRGERGIGALSPPRGSSASRGRLEGVSQWLQRVRAIPEDTENRTLLAWPEAHFLTVSVYGDADVLCQLMLARAI